MLSKLKTFRAISIFEGISAIVLFFIAMPVKYLLDSKKMVEVVGMLHGVLFVIYVLFAIHIAYKLKWSFKTLFYVMIASVFPFGTFVMDKKILVPIIQKKMQ